MPLIIQEMEQALVVDISPNKLLDNAPQVLGNMNFVQLCGPIVEVVGERLQFVHFTVSECVFASSFSTS